VWVNTNTPTEAFLFHLHEPLRWRAERDPKAKMLDLQSFLRQGVSSGYVGLNRNLKDLTVLAYVGKIQNLKDLKDATRARGNFFW
jgi:hypothetical protein